MSKAILIRALKFLLNGNLKETGTANGFLIFQVNRQIVHLHQDDQITCTCKHASLHPAEMCSHKIAVFIFQYGIKYANKRIKLAETINQKRT